MSTFIHARYLERILGKFDPDGHVTVLLSSRDPELGRYLRSVPASASIDMDADGTIYLKVDDRPETTKGCLLEECAHALQFLRDGNIPLSCDSLESDRRELEVAECLSGRVHSLDPEDISHYRGVCEALRNTA